MGNGDDNQKSIVINFIDPLFSVVLSMSFAQIYDKDWFKNVVLIWNEPNRFQVATLILGYLTVIMSWVGYHRSIKSTPINVDTKSGRWRFGLDIALLIAYFILLVSFGDLRRELWLLVIINFLFVPWDQLKRLEVLNYNQHDTLGSSRRRGVTVFWFFIFFIVALLYEFWPPQVRYECKDWLILLVAIGGTVLYRFHKNRLWFKPLLDWLGLPKANA